MMVERKVRRDGYPSVSPSAIRDWLTCPRRYKLSRDPKTKGMSSSTEAMRVGTLVHLWLERYANLLVSEGKLRMVDEGIELIDAVMEGEPNAAQVEAERLCRVILERNVALLPDGAYQSPWFATEKRIALNRQLEPCEWDDPKRAFRCILDVCWTADDGETLVIRDWKTNRVPATSVQSDIQLAMYSWAALQLPEFKDCKRTKAYLNYVRFAHEVGVLWPRKAVEKVGERVMGWRKAIGRDDEYPARVGPACEHCTMRSACVDFHTALTKPNPMRVATGDDAISAGKAYLAMGAARKELSGSLKRWVDERGPLDVGQGYVLDSWVRERDELRNPRGVFRALLDAGIQEDEVWRAFTSTKKGVKDVLVRAGYTKKKAANLADDLFADFGVRKITPIFEARRVPVDLLNGED
jgi:CRISPR/Cas system-associated exonuclease Cas4 (RecB family)